MNEQRKKILITGASSGIGKETAVSLAKKGNLIFAGVRKKSDKTVLEAMHSNIKGVYIDVTAQASIEKAFEFVKKHTVKLDVLINNAGIAVAAPIELISLKRLKEQFMVNTFGAITTVQCFLPLLQNARIINISSIASTGLFPYISPYCASKRALDILMNSFYLENKNNIKVISIKPASIKTPIWIKSIQAAESEFLSCDEEKINKYKQDFELMKKYAFISNDKGINVEQAVKIIEKAIYAKNPKSSYDVGFSSTIAQLVAKLPQDLINKIVSYKLNRHVRHLLFDEILS